MTQLTIEEKLLKKQNINIEKEEQKLKDTNTTYDRKTHFQLIRHEQVTYAHNVLFWLYYLVAVIALYFLYKSPKYRLFYKIIIAILFGIFPFIISTIEVFIYYIFYYIYVMIFGMPYKK
tara:strand:- start:2989 stop:3345 length:357 start_codon:yes stop_codon:yes gene_type:complete